MLKHLKWLSALGLFLFVIGLLVGQQTQRSKFDKYLRGASVSQMQISILEANMDVIRAYLPLEVPVIYYDQSCSCFPAHATIASEVTKKPFDELRSHLTVLVDTARSQLSLEVPEVSERDFKMTFTELNLEHPDPPRTIPEYANGKLMFK
jgi:hypothetical protein